jgi:hypothetical protein
MVPPVCSPHGGTFELYNPLGITVLAVLAISGVSVVRATCVVRHILLGMFCAAISMGALIGLLVYVRKMMLRLNAMMSKMEVR